MDLNVLIVGGGIHGVGVLHDLSTRKITGVHLVEERTIASGTSSKSTKLIHGGLRYLEHFSQWPLVYEALQERTLLLKILSEIVKPLPFVLPHFKHHKRPSWLIQTGLFCYDLLAGDSGLPVSKKINKQEVFTLAPYLKKEKIDLEMSCAFLYYDAQMLDDVITKIIAKCSLKMGNSFEEHSRVTKVRKNNEGFVVTIKKNKEEKEMTTKYLINATGAWCNKNLLQWGFLPKTTCLLNLGSHLVFEPHVVPHKKPYAATLIQEENGRILFFIPWNSKWLLGTTESILPKGTDPFHLEVPKTDQEILMNAATSSFDLYDAEKNISESFCGVRCMPLNAKTKVINYQEQWRENPYHSPFYVTKLDKNISSLSRETLLEESPKGLISLYGGKFTTYRAVSQKIGALLCHKLKQGTSSGTHLKENWFFKELLEEDPHLFESSPELRKSQI